MGYILQLDHIVYLFIYLFIYFCSLSSFDVLVFGYLDLIAQYELPGNNQLGTRLKSLVQLTNFCSNIREKACPEISSSTL